MTSRGVWSWVVGHGPMDQMIQLYLHPIFCMAAWRMGGPEHFWGGRSPKKFQFLQKKGGGGVRAIFQNQAMQTCRRAEMEMTLSFYNYQEFEVGSMRDRTLPGSRSELHTLPFLTQDIYFRGW